MYKVESNTADSGMSSIMQRDILTLNNCSRFAVNLILREVMKLPSGHDTAVCSV
jgi:hypothetical protein